MKQRVGLGAGAERGRVGARMNGGAAAQSRDQPHGGVLGPLVSVGPEVDLVVGTVSGAQQPIGDIVRAIVSAQERDHVLTVRCQVAQYSGRPLGTRRETEGIWVDASHGSDLTETDIPALAHTETVWFCPRRFGDGKPPMTI